MAVNTIKDKRNGTSSPIHDKRIENSDIQNWNGKYDFPEGGIPVADLSQEARDMLVKAVDAFEAVTWKNLTGSLQNPDQLSFRFGSYEAYIDPSYTPVSGCIYFLTDNENKTHLIFNGEEYGRDGPDFTEAQWATINSGITADDKTEWNKKPYAKTVGDTLYISAIPETVLSISGSIVSWSAIPGVDSYKVYADNALIGTVSNLTFDLSSVIFVDGSYSITVRGYSNSNVYGIPSNGVNYRPVTVSPVLDNNDWGIISTISAADTGANYWSVGDVKSIHIEGTCGTLSLNDDFYVYILGFDHNESFEGKGITFGGFKTADVNKKDIALIDSHYNTASTDGSKWFNMSHWSNINYGGWAGCDMRYDILGSTDVAPSGYGSAPTTSRVGYDATSTCATNPVANTLMSCLPSELRAVMKPMTKYTDNASGGSHNAEANVTASVDYLPLLAEYEIFGARTYANEHEYKKQAQYAYYVAGNSKVKYQHSSTGSTARWWERSPISNGSNVFCGVYSDGAAYNYQAQTARGVAPVFLV